MKENATSNLKAVEIFSFMYVSMSWNKTRSFVSADGKIVHLRGGTGQKF
jgi:hypothetical protein